MTHRCNGPRRWAALGAWWVGAVSAAAVALGQVGPDETVKGFEVAEGLEATVWATEPMLVNPTNIDVDARGRVWVAEGANYRTSITRPEGDRIVILEDTDHDGKADSQKVFAQDPELAAPLGIAVLGNKVYVSQSPRVWVYTIDESGDKPAGKPEVWMSGFAGVNHDHGVHAITFGHDGRLYFTAGNDGCSSKEPFRIGGSADRPVVDSLGSHVPRGPLWRGSERPKGTLGYQQGMAFRCNADGSGFETLGHNFRNNYELAVDSFGTVWQSDNDDDGNESARLNYVMEGGNFGFRGPRGHDWTRDAAAFPGQSRQEAHWHLRWPGVVPNLLNTGRGSPTGIVSYEGELLPERFRGALIHSEPGHHVVRAYVPRPSAQTPVKKFDQPDSLTGPDRDGAGYRVDVVNVLTAKDRWFRPSDVCVAPDGSLFVADWYDPGVGGHQTGDKPQNQGLRGRIYRVAPKGHKPVAPKADLGTTGGQIAALMSPNVAVRHLAFTKLRAAGDGAADALRKVFDADPNPRHRARALWLLAQTGKGRDADVLSKAIADKDVDIRLAGLRAARLVGYDLLAGAAVHIGSDRSPAAVLREYALAMTYQPADKAVPILVTLANKFDGEDRWYLEALGIGATGKEDAVLAAWQRSGTNREGKAGELIRWRLKRELPEVALTKLDEKTQLIAGWWAAAPFDAADRDGLETDFGPEVTSDRIDPNAGRQGVGGKTVKWERIGTTPFENGPFDGLMAVDFEAFCAARGARTTDVVGYFAATLVSPVDQTGKLVLGSDDGCRAWVNGRQVLSRKMSRAMAYGDDVVPIQLRRGNNVLMVKLQQGQGAGGLIVAVAGEKQKVTLSDAAPTGSAEPMAQAAAPAAASSDAPAAAGGSNVPVSKDGSPLPTINDLAKLTGDAKAGAAVFANAGGANCVACHQVGMQGQMLGPPLGTIGQKLNKPQLYEAILKPNAGILMGFENWVARTKQGAVISGLKTSETPEGVTIKDTQGKYHDLASDDVARLVKQQVSIMPENLSQTMTQQELVDLVEYLSTLRNP